MLLLVAPLFSWPASRVEELFMVRSWYSREVLWNGPAWSISAEWFAYLCLFPLASLFFGRIRSVPSLVIVVTLFLAAHAYSFGEILFSNLSRCGEICFLFPAGCGLYRIYTLVKNPPAEKIVLLGLLLFSLYVICSDELTVFILYVAFALLIFGLAYERGFLARLLSTRIVVWGGLISYSLYMTHALIIRIAVVHTLSYWQRWSHQELTFMRYAVLSVMLVALIGMAAAFYYLIEVPANKKLRAFWATLENAHWKFGQE
jgi:peptidoglycan/LPS O-acetylase OafA/YrhL